MSSVLKTIFSHFTFCFYIYLYFHVFFYNSTINTVKFKSFVEVYPIEGNPIEVYPIEAYLIGKGVVEVSGCSPLTSDRSRNSQAGRLNCMTVAKDITKLS
jgi:hypothetical protein